jgi:hypothetical protein
MRMPTLVLATLSLWLTSPLDSLWAQGGRGDELFQRALVLERSSGELDGAAEVYRRIVREFPADRPLVAKALVRLGLTLEVLGQARSARCREIDRARGRGNGVTHGHGECRVYGLLDAGFPRR